MLSRLNTGVQCTPEELLELEGLAEEAQKVTPADLSAGPIPYPDETWKKVGERVNEIAALHGLPEIQGFYGVDPQGQFVTYVETPDQEENEQDE